MDRLPRFLWRSAPLKIALIYLLISVLWIVFSDQLVAFLFQDRELITRVQTLKGWFFVGSTAVLIYMLMQREIAAYERTSENLARSSQELRDILDAMPVGISITDGSTIEYININFSQRYGYSLDEIPTEQQWFLLAYPDPQYRDPLFVQWQQELMRAREQRTPVKPFEIHITCKNGEVRQAIANTQMIGKRIVVIFTDITERELLQNELVKMQKLESIGLLAGGLAHDFNNILTGIMGNLSYARILLDPQSPACEPLKAAENAATRAVDVTAQLLTFAQGGEPMKKVLAVGDLIKESMDLMLRGRNVKGETAVQENLWCIEGDGGQISQVLNNIIINAVQAMPDGGLFRIAAENAPVEEGAVSALEPGRYVQIVLEDTGVGMPAEVMERIFDPYFTTKAEGSGLGLASAYSIINRHGGLMSVDSTPGQGTRFTLLLPAAEARAVAREQEPSAAETIGDDRQGRILVMDDEAAICDIASTMLGYLGYDVDICADGAEAVARYTQAQEGGQGYDAVIMDLTVPGGMGGKEAARQILARDSQACLIVSSGYSHDPIMADYRSYGFKGVLAKPYKVGGLGQVLATVLPHAPMKRAHSRSA